MLLYFGSLAMLVLALRIWFKWTDVRHRRERTGYRLTAIESQLREMSSRLHWLELHQGASQGDFPASHTIGMMKWAGDNPGEFYRWLQKVPSDACALLCPSDCEACWQNYCLQRGECGFLLEHAHRRTVSMRCLEICSACGFLVSHHTSHG